MNIKNAIRQKIKSKWMYNSFFWRVVLNGKDSIKFLINRPTLTTFQKEILDELNQKGIVSFQFDQLFGDNNLFETLGDFYLLHRERHLKEIEEQQSNVGLLGKKKNFIYSILEHYNNFDPNNPMVKVPLDRKLKNIIDAYFGLSTDLRYYDIWQTFISGDKAPMRSQLWHRDPEDYLILKVFIYLSDVDEGAGPFIYAPGTHPKGPIRKEAPWFREEGHGAKRTEDDQITSLVAKDKWITATGEKGTVIIADTRGYHKGGYAKEKERIMYNCMYVSNSSYFQPTFKK